MYTLTIVSQFEQNVHTFVESSAKKNRRLTEISVCVK